jgi:hypothetical protein
MKVGLAIHSLLTSNGAVQALISGRVYPEIAPEGVALPYIVYSVRSNQPSNNKRSTPVDEAQVEIFSVDNNYSDANDLADKVRAALDRKNISVSVSEGSIDVQSITYDNEVTEVSPDRKVYASVQDYTFRINR